jgi:hypothetical protein
MKKKKSDVYALRLYNLYVSGLVVIILVILQTFLGLDRLDNSILISVGAFALALPPLAGAIIVNFVEETYPYGHTRSIRMRAVNSLLTLGVIAGLTGIDAAFWHISWISGIIFFVTLIITIAIYGWYIAELE